MRGIKLIAAAAAALAVAVLIYDRLHWKRWRELESRGSAATGWVTGKSDGKERLVHYNFRVEERLYSGFDTTGTGTPDFDELEPGQEIVVFYHKENPEQSCLGHPRDRLRAQHHVLVYLVIGGLPLLGLALKSELSRASA